MSRIIALKNLCDTFEDDLSMIKIANLEYDPLVERCMRTKSKSCFITLKDGQRIKIRCVAGRLLFYRHPDEGYIQLYSIDLIGLLTLPHSS